MRGITFNNLPPLGPTEPARMDVVCFIGFVPLAERPFFSETLKDWLVDYGWDQEKILRLSENPELIRNTPVPLESWDAFCAVFDSSRLDRVGQVRGLSLRDPLTVTDEDLKLHVIVDRREMVVELTPGAGGEVSLEALVGQLNERLKDGGASASTDSTTNSYLIIKRNDDVREGELTVYRNRSLGFPNSFQADSRYVQNYSGAAVRSFFRHGGRKCYFISMGNPLTCEAGDADRGRQLYALMWGKETETEFSRNGGSFAPNDFLHMSLPEIPNGASPLGDWKGLSHLAGLSDVTYVSFPDLIDVPGRPAEEEPEKPTAGKKEVFVVCGKATEETPWSFTTSERVPLFNEAAYRVWKRIICHVLDYLTVHAPTVQLVAGFPLPDKGIQKDFTTFVLKELLGEAEEGESRPERLHITFPWLKTDLSDGLPEGLQPPDGILLGLLAAQSRRIGAFRSIAGSLVDGAFDLFPQNMDAYTPPPSDPEGLTLADRVSWFDFVPAGITLQSDVTAVREGNCRYGAVRRIMILVQRTAHRIGLDYVFEPSSHQIWRAVREGLSDLLHQIYLRNGLRGRSSKEAYSVSCGSSTMTQNDIDNGRLIANVILQPAAPIERIAVDILVEKDKAVLLGNGNI
jgi:uncharacterized protein